MRVQGLYERVHVIKRRSEGAHTYYVSTTYIPPTPLSLLCTLYSVLFSFSVFHILYQTVASRELNISCHVTQIAWWSGEANFRKNLLYIMLYGLDIQRISLGSRDWRRDIQHGEVMVTPHIRNPRLRVVEEREQPV